MGGRIQCSGCGANNFDTVTVCWKCSRPLSAGAAASGQASNSGARQSGVQHGSLGGGYTPPTMDRPASAYPAVHPIPYSEKLANNSAVALGLLFPYVALPVAIAFMMLPDHRKQAVGKLCLMWGILSTVLHSLLLFAVLLGARQYFGLGMNTLQGALQRQQNQMRGMGLEP